MSLKLVYLAAKIEQSDDFHIARLILLLNAAAGTSDKPVKDIMKLAKMDFLLRYPNCLFRALKAIGKDKVALTILEEEEELDTIEARMIRFRFGPWDKRYRRWIGILVSKGLAHTYLEGRTVNVKLTAEGKQLAGQLSDLDEFRPIAKRSKIVVSSVGAYSPRNLKKFIYDVFPEIVDMK
jgi:predicted transcriptional regulator